VERYFVSEAIKILRKLVRFRDFFYFGSVSSHESMRCFRWSKVTLSTVSWSVSLLPVGMRVRMRSHVHAIKNMYVQWYIDLFRSRARSKGIGFTSFFLLYVTSLVTRSQFLFLPASFLFSRSVFRSPMPSRYANLRFEKLIARLSTCPCCVPPLSDLAQESTRADRWMLRCSMHVRASLMTMKCVSARASHLIHLCEDFLG